jgi:activator of 2-hydroxyglutaryl-CoA dehydratase
VEIGAGEAGGVAVYEGRDRLRWWVEEGQQEEKAKAGGRALVACAEDLTSFVAEFDLKRAASARGAAELAGPVLVGCDFGSTTAKAVVLSPTRELLFTCYALSKGNPIEDAQSLFRQVREAGYTEVGGLALTGYGKDLLKDVVGADVAVVETVAHATGTLHFHPDADVICDVGGTDVKIMILRQGTVADFRLNSQCSSGNGAFLQGVAERYAIPLEAYAEKAFEAKARDGLRRVSPVGHRQPAAEGLGRRGDHGRAGRGAAGERVDLRRTAAESQIGRAQVRAAGRNASQHGGGEGPGGLHPRQGAGSRRGAASLLG